jgi:hypothetical protein
MDTILKMMRERMDVDTYSRIEGKKQSYFAHYKETENDCKDQVNQALAVFN